MVNNKMRSLRYVHIVVRVVDIEVIEITGERTCTKSHGIRFR